VPEIGRTENPQKSAADDFAIIGKRFVLRVTRLVQGKAGSFSGRRYGRLAGSFGHPY
jgi:hypothetical protein